LVEELRAALTPSSIILAFLTDGEELGNRLNEEYLEEIIRLAKIEDKHHLETKNPSLVDAWRQYASRA